MKWRERAAVSVMCDCGAEADCDRVHLSADVPTRDGTMPQRADALDLPTGWTLGHVAPVGKPVLTLGGASHVDQLRDTDADVATKIGIPQRTLRCPACSAKARDRASVESAGAVVVGMDGRPIQ